ncbi:MAG: DMT family transporter [Clostridia bacterium]|nr:DMT family transporter [Clostridia bacterium]
MKLSDKKVTGHVLALITIIVWGSTFITTKMLLSEFTPVQIMLCRFVIAYFVLWLIRPKIDKTKPKDELLFLAMGVFGCTVYFLAENTALKYTLASNVSIIVASAPIITAILAHFFIKGEKFSKNTALGFIVAFAGVILVVFNGQFVLKLNPAGDALSLCAAVSWAVYSVILRTCVDKFNSVMLTRKLMFYGFVTAFPIALLQGDSMPFEAFKKPDMLFCILFLGVIGSGICYVMWNKAISRLGVVTTNNYIYINPFVTLVTGGIFLKEPITVMGVAGALLIISGVVISSKKKKEKV